MGNRFCRTFGRILLVALRDTCCDTPLCPELKAKPTCHEHCRSDAGWPFPLSPSGCDKGLLYGQEPKWPNRAASPCRHYNPFRNRCTAVRGVETGARLRMALSTIFPIG